MKDNEAFKVQFDSTNSLQNDFRQIAVDNNIEYSVDNQNTQTLTIKHPDNFIVVLTIPDKIFEWFVDVYDAHNLKLTSDWYEGYGDENQTLIKEKQSDIEAFIQNVVKNKIRFITEKKLFKKVLSFQYNDSGV